MTERERFEAWHTERWGKPSRLGQSDQYKMDSSQGKWQAWQAALAASAPKGLKHADNCATNLDGDMRGACDCTSAPKVQMTDAEIDEITSRLYGSMATEQERHFARAILARSAPNAELVAALTQMVSWFGSYPEFVPAKEAIYNVRVSIVKARAALAAVGA